MKRDAPRILWLGLPAALLLGAYLGGALQETREARVSQRLQDKLSQLENNRPSFATARDQPPSAASAPFVPATEKDARQIVDKAVERGSWTKEDAQAWLRVSQSLSPETQSEVLQRATLAINRQELSVAAGSFPN